jgi:hypothetical protein
MTSPHTIARGLALPLVATLALGLAACSDDDSSDDAVSAEEQVCEDWAQLESSVTALRDVDVVADGTDALRSAVDGVSTAVDELGDSAGDQVGDEVDALGTAVDDLGDELRGIGDDPQGESAGTDMAALGEAVQQVATAADDLKADLQPNCTT